MIWVNYVKLISSHPEELCKEVVLWERHFITANVYLLKLVKNKQVAEVNEKNWYESEE